ncbi:MAG: hypothetical protein FJ315_09060 [SAR202 cluster bacterium]|nr:hypothetical protein [SAR202 cluster bacterium]
MYERILVPVDGSPLSEQVLPYVRLLAKALKAKVDLLHVLEPVQAGFGASALKKAPATARDAARDYVDGLGASPARETLAVSGW